MSNINLIIDQNFSNPVAIQLPLETEYQIQKKEEKPRKETQVVNKPENPKFINEKLPVESVWRSKH